MATRTWNGDVDTTFATAGNWSSNTAPVSGDTIVFDSSADANAVLTNLQPSSGQFAEVIIENNFDQLLVFNHANAQIKTNKLTIKAKGKIKDDAGGKITFIGGGTSGVFVFFNHADMASGPLGMFDTAASRSRMSFDFGSVDATTAIKLENGVYPNLLFLGNSNNNTTFSPTAVTAAGTNTYPTTDILAFQTDSETSVIPATKNQADLGKTFKIHGSLYAQCGDFNWGNTTLEIQPQDATGSKVPYNGAYSASGNFRFGTTAKVFKAKYNHLRIAANSGKYFEMDAGAILSCNKLTILPDARFYGPDTTVNKGAEIQSVEQPTVVGDWNFSQLSDGIYRTRTNPPPNQEYHTILTNNMGSNGQVLAISSGGELEWSSSAGGADVTVQDEGSALSTAATTFNFVGNGVVASGSGATKTITITDTDTNTNQLTEFTLAGDSGSSQTIGHGNTVTIAGGTNITSVASATDTITLNVDDAFLKNNADDATTGTITAAGMVIDKSGSSGQTGALTIKGSRTAGVEYAKIDFHNKDGDSGNFDYIGGRISVTNASDATNDGTMVFKTNNANAGLATALTIADDTKITTASDLTVGGNLTVSGTTTTIDTNTVNIGDSIITLNSDETGTPSQDGGIEIERGTSTNKSFIWDESEDKWSVGSDTMVAGTFEGASADIGDIQIRSNNEIENDSSSIFLQYNTGNDVEVGSTGTNADLVVVGRVGIAPGERLNSPSALLHVNGGSGEAMPLRLERATQGGANYGVGLEFVMGETGNANAERVYGELTMAMDGASGNAAGGSAHDGYFAIRPSLNGTPTERMRITSAGKVGVGVTNPYANLTVNENFLVSSAGDTADPKIEGILQRITGTSNDNPNMEMFFVENHGLGYGFRMHYDGSNNRMRFYTHDNDANGSEVMRFNRAAAGDIWLGPSGSKVMIGSTNSPDTSLHVVGSSHRMLTLERQVDNEGYWAGIEFQLGDDNSATAGHIYGIIGGAIEDHSNNNEDGFLTFQTSLAGTTAEKMRITSDGTIEHMKDTNAIAYHGRAAIGYVGHDDYAAFGHLDTFDTGGYALLQFSDGRTFLNAENGQDIRFRIHNSDKMILKSDGKFGIGTTSPSILLDVDGVSGYGGALDTSGTGSGTAAFVETKGIRLGKDSAAGQSAPIEFMASHWGVGYGWKIQNKDTSGGTDLLFYSRRSVNSWDEEFRITDDGKVGIGGVNPDSPLHVIVSDTDEIEWIAELRNTPNPQASGLGNFGAGIKLALSSGSGNELLKWAGMAAVKSPDLNYSRKVDAAFYTQTDAGNGVAPTEKMRITGDGNVGIGTTAPEALLDVNTGVGIAIQMGADVNAATLTNDTRKYGRFATPHYHNAEEPIGLVVGDSDGTDNIVNIGGGSNAVNAATSIRFWSAANDATTVGTERMRITSDGYLGIGVTSPLAPLSVYHAVTNPNLDATGGNAFAQHINVDLSGSTSTTGDREQGGLYIDLDTNATGGDTNHEHRPYGIWVDARQNSAGDSDALYGVYSYVESQRNSASTTATTNQTAIYGHSVSDETTDNTVSNLMGVYGSFSIQDAGVVSNAFGLRAHSSVHNNRSTNTGTLHGCAAEIDIAGTRDGNSGRSNANITTAEARVFESVFDHNVASSGEGTVTVSSSFLYYGNASITDAAQVTNNWGVYINGETKNYFSGKVGIGTTSPGTPLQVTSGSGYLKFDTSGSVGSIKSDFNLDLYADDTDGNSSGYQNIRFFTAGANERMRVAHDGKVGIGTTSPDTLFEIKEGGTGAAVMRLRNSNTSYPDDTAFGRIEFYNADASGAGITAQIEAVSDASGRGGQLAFKTDPSGTSPSTRMFIQGDGKVGIGDTTPSYKLDVAGDIRAQDDMYTDKLIASEGIRSSNRASFNTMNYFYYDRQSMGTSAVFLRTPVGGSSSANPSNHSMPHAGVVMQVMMVFYGQTLATSGTDTWTIYKINTGGTTTSCDFDVNFANLNRIGTTGNYNMLVDISVLSDAGNVTFAAGDLIQIKRTDGSPIDVEHVGAQLWVTFDI